MLTKWLRNLRRRLLNLRRRLLKIVVPEFVWPTVVNVDGVTVPLRGAPYSFGVKRLLVRNGYEVPERLIVAQVLSPGTQVIELGCSIVILAAVISHGIGPTGKLVTVEASAELAAQAEGLLQSSPQATVVHGFGFPVAELETTYSPVHFVEDQGSLGGFLQFDPERSNTNTLPQDLIWDLNRLGNTFGITADLLVCDIEGSEIVLLSDSWRLPASIRDIVIEIHPQFLPNGVADSERIVQRIMSEGFKLRERDGLIHGFRGQ